MLTAEYRDEWSGKSNEGQKKANSRSEDVITGKRQRELDSMLYRDGGMWKIRN